MDSHSWAEIILALCPPLPRKNVAFLFHPSLPNVARLKPFLLSLRSFGAALLVFVLFLALHLRDNAFPHFYHTDEPSKVEQILTGQRNGRHPTLLLNSAKLILGLTQWTLTRDHAARAGRIASAIFAAAAVALLFLWAGCQSGWIAAVLAASFAGFQQPLLTAAHFVKEDPALLLGLAATLLAAFCYSEKPTPARAFWLGLAAGLAFSGKWVGVIALLYAAGQLILSRKTATHPAQSWLLFIAGFPAIFALTNHDLIAQWNVVSQGVSSEVTSFYSTDAGEARGFHFLHYLRRLPEVFSSVLLALALLGAGVIWKGKASLHTRLFSTLPFLWFLVIACIPKTETRYLLPISTFLALLAALGAAALIRAAANRGTLPAIAAAILASAVVFSLLPAYGKAVDSFHHDHRQELAEWIEKNLPSSVNIAQDGKVALPVSTDSRFDPAPTPGLSRHILPGNKNYVSDYGDLASLRARGVTHVALFLSNYLVLEEREAKKASTSQKRAALRLYRKLQSEGRVVFQRKKGFDRYLNVGLVLYEITPPVLREREPSAAVRR